MTEYAKLVISVDSTQARSSADALGRLESAGRSTEQGMSRLERQTRSNEQASRQFASTMGVLKTALVAAVSATALRSMADMVQRYQEMSERVQMATSSTAEYEMVQKRLMQTANGTYRALGEAQELYIRTADSLRSMGYETQQALDITDSMSYAFVVNATSAERADAAITAFSKSVTTGKVAADQWETLTTAMPTIIDDIAEASGRGAAEIRAMGAAGKLTARDLTEGLRKSLADNAAAAENMASTLRDAGVIAKDAATAILVSFENQTGAIQGVTKTIISASKATQAFYEDAENMASVLRALEGAALAVGSVMAGRLLTAVAAYGVSQIQAAAATISRLKAEQLALSAAARRAAAEKVAAFNAVAVAKAEFAAAQGTNAHAFAANNLIAAQTRAAQAASTNAVAQQALNSTMTAGRVAANGLRTAMAFLGGPLGVVLLAATAVYAFGGAAREANKPTVDLADSVKDLTAAQRELGMIQAQNKLEELGEKAKAAQEKIDAATAAIEKQNEATERGFVRGADRGPNDVTERMKAIREGLLEEQVALEGINGEMEAYQKRLNELRNFQPGAGSQSSDQAPEPTTTPDGQRALERMREQLELAKLQGEARARLSAIQALGAEATEKERLEAEQLAAEIYRLEDAQKAAAKASDEAASAAKKSADEAKRQAEEKRQYVSQLERQVDLLGKSAAEVRRYELNERELTGTLEKRAQAALEIIDATERQEAYKALLLDLRTEEEQLTDLMRERLAVLDAMSGLTDAERDKAAGRIADAAIKDAPEFAGLAPEVGGALGELDKIEDAEAELQAWYDTQLEMLNQYREERADLAEQWDEQERALHQEHQDSLAEIERARQIAQMAAGEEFFGNMSDAARTFFGEHSDLYRAAFAVEKAYAIGKALMNVPKSYSDAFAAVVGIPVVGPALAPIAGGAAAAAQVAQAAAIGKISMSGMAHDGIDSIPKEGTWLLDKGERVVDRRTNQDLKQFLAGGSEGGDGKAPNVQIINNGQPVSAKTSWDGRDLKLILDAVNESIVGGRDTSKAIQRSFGLKRAGQ